MIRNYIKIAWRNLVRNKAYSALNIVGLATGMAVALLIALWVVNEYSYDRSLPDYARLYQLEMNLTSTHDGTHTQNNVSIPVVGALKKQYPEIKYIAESDGMRQHNLMVGDKKLYIKGAAVGTDFLNMFQYKLIKGNASTAFTDAYSIVLTKSLARSLFGNADPINKLVKIDNRNNLKVTAVIDDLPKNSTFQFKFLFPFNYVIQSNDWMKQEITNWTNNSYQVFIMLQPGADHSVLNNKIKNLVLKNSERMRYLKPELWLHPMQDWHLYSDFKDGRSVGGFIDYVRMFSLIGLLVLLIACINFMNLATARSEKRAREVGVRKAIGSKRGHLIVQFLTESVMITMISFILSIVIVLLALPHFNKLTGNSIGIPYTSAIFWVAMLSYVILTGLLAGSKPAFYLSSFSPSRVLKGAIKTTGINAFSRKALVVVQFSCSIVLIISTVVIYRQIQHVKSRPTGYESDRLVITDMSDDLNKNYNSLRADLLQAGLVENITRATSSATEVHSHTTLEDWPGKTAQDEEINISSIYTSETYFETLSISLIAGKDFSQDWRVDTNNVIVNEAAVKRMGLKDPINQLISWNNHDGGRVRIIGVVKDALMESPFTSVMPAIFSHLTWGSYAMYRVPKNADTHATISKIGQVFDRYNPAYTYSYRFVDDEYNKKFNLEVLVGKLAGIFACLAIFVSCLGLFGLAAYLAEQRTKEIGIRKVLGASVTQVWMMLSSDFILLVSISCLIASPVALYFLQSWLQKYDYRISIGPGVFLISAITAIIITLCTISFQAIKAALANPVKSLRSE